MAACSGRCSECWESHLPQPGVCLYAPQMGASPPFVVLAGWLQLLGWSLY